VRRRGAARAPLLLAVALAASPAAPAAHAAGPTVLIKGRVLAITGTAQGDRVVVLCDGTGFVRVNKKPPDNGVAPCSQIAEVDVVAGAGNDRVDLSGVGSEFGKASFPDFGFGVATAGLLGPGKDDYIGSETGFNLVLANAGADTARGGEVRDVFTGGTGDDRLVTLGGRDLLLGKPGADTLLGGDEADLISGNGGNDLLSGARGADVLGGGGGRDTLIGGPGADRLLGGIGEDRLRGGAGKDFEQQNPPKK
jgi:Ca2+-binding RTX toxin-like protein